MLFLTPRKALARHVSVRLRKTFSRVLNTPTLLLSRDQDIDAIPADASSFIAVSSPLPLLQHLIDDPELFGTLDLIVAHDLHALDPAYELLLSRLRWTHPQTRVVGSSSALLDATDLVSWLGATPRSSYAFSPATRSSSLTTSFQSFSTPHSASLLRSMIKPAYAAMRLASGSTICFVPSRAQCRAAANDLVTQTAADLEQSFVVGSLETVEVYARSISDPDLAEALTHGIAVFHEGLRPDEQRLALDLFNSGAVRILIASREACWTLPVRASLVIVMSAQYAVVQEDGERQIKDYALPELLQMQTLAIPPASDASAECLILCQAEQADLYGRFLLQGLPLESELPFDPLLASTLFVDLAMERIKTRQDVVDSFSWTYFARRLESNPSYYYTQTHGEINVDDQLSRLADRVLQELEARCCLVFQGEHGFALTLLGQLFDDRGVQLADVARLQSADLARLVLLTESSAPSRPRKDADIEAGVVALKSFHQRLPRAVRDVIGAEEGVLEADFRRRVLLGAFRAGKIPRGAGQLEAEQAVLLKRLLDTSGV